MGHFLVRLVSYRSEHLHRQILKLVLEVYLPQLCSVLGHQDIRSDGRLPPPESDQVVKFAKPILCEDTV